MSAEQTGQDPQGTGPHGKAYGAGQQDAPKPAQVRSGAGMSVSENHSVPVPPDDWDFLAGVEKIAREWFRRAGVPLPRVEYSVADRTGSCTGATLEEVRDSSVARRQAIRVARLMLSSADGATVIDLQLRLDEPGGLTVTSGDDFSVAGFVQRVRELAASHNVVVSMWRRGWRRFLRWIPRRLRSWLGAFLGALVIAVLAGIIVALIPLLQK